jgi:methionyl-tRNA formyltransferase
VRLVFLGSPPFATPVLGRLVRSSFRPSLVVTPPPRPRGRGRRVEPSPVAELARAERIEAIQPATVRDEPFLERLRAEDAEVFLVVSYGELLRPEFLEIPSRVTLNVHPSLLPRHRGASPIQAAILAGDRETGVSIQRVVLELDAGDVLVERRTAVLPGETAGELAERLAELSGEAVLEALMALERGDARFTPQDPSRVTLCKRLEKADGRIDWSQSARDLERHVRAMNPWPTAETLLPSGGRLAVLRARLGEGGETGDAAPGSVLAAGERLVVATGEGALELLEVRAAGRRPMDVASWLRGARLAPGERLG